MSSNYKEVTLADISIDGKGSYGISASAVDYSEDLYTYLRITDITDDGNLIKDGLKSVNDEKAEKYILKPNDIVFARTGNSTGRSYFYDGRDGELVYAGFLIKFSLDPKKVNPKFIRYYTLSEEYKNWVSSFSTGSTRGNINAKTYGNMKIKLPDRKQQDFLVQILSDIDEKIEINNKINDNLEKIAQAIFKQWFLDFEFPNENGEPYKSSGGEMMESELGMIPKGWEVIKLHEIGNLTMGLSPKSEAYNVIGEGTPLLNGAADFNGGLIKATKYTKQITRTCRKKDLVFCIRATIGNITFADREYCLGRGVASIEPKDKLYVGLIYMNLLKSMENLKAKATGSVILGLSKPDINDMKLILPKNDMLNKFSDMFNKVFNKKHILELENDKLIEARDTLLPKLMSGEIRVPSEKN